MGFWHTGYIEFHEEVGFGSYEYEPSPPAYPCAACGEIFQSDAALQKHRFESHPLRLPTFILRNRECGTRPIVITSKLHPADVYVERCDQASVNGEAVPVETLGHKLAARSSGTCHVTLRRGDAARQFMVEFRIASEHDLRGVDREFKRIATKGHLDMRTVEDLIAATEQFETAGGYSGGICTYLYGVLAKERAVGCPLSYEMYEKKFEQSVEDLSGYDRPLARTIISAIEFHHNHFLEAALSGRNSRIAGAARKYLRWLNGDGSETPFVSEPRSTGNTIESWITDRETEEVVRWTMQSAQILARQSANLEAFLKRQVSDFDRVKVRILISEVYAVVGKTTSAARHAKNLSNIKGFEDWAERIIHACSERAE